MTKIELFMEEFTKKANEMYDLIKKHGVEKDVELVIGASHTDWEDPQNPKMKLATAFNVGDLDDFEETLVAIQYMAEASEEPEEGTIDWWMKNFGDNESLN